MRLSYWLILIWMIATVLTVGREPTGRVAIVVFVTGLAEIVLGTTAIMTLFKTLGAIGQARTLWRYAEAVMATSAVLLLASLTMNMVFWLGVSVVRVVVP